MITDVKLAAHATCPTTRTTSRTRPWTLLAPLAAVVALIAAGCGTSDGTSDGTASRSGVGSGADRSGVVCAGPRHAASGAWVQPVATDPAPTLPTTVTDFTGEQVTVTDASRILALDTYGTLATTVYALGLGDHLVGRDVSTGVPALKDLPVVTHNGHELNAEAILDLNPSVILTDYSIGPLEVQLQLKDSGIPVVILDSQRNRAVIDDQIHAVANVLGVPVQGDALAAKVTAEVDAAVRDVAAMADVASAPRIVFLYLRGSAGVYYWFGKGTGADDLIAALGGVKADVVLSDMASHATGHRQTDHINIIALVEAGYDFAKQVLKPGGTYLAKVLRGGTESQLLTMMKKDFASVRHVKPMASRDDSAELFVLAMGYRG